MSIKRELDEILNWYDAYGHRPAQIPVICRPRTLAKFARKRERGGPYVYRGSVVVGIKPARVRACTEHQRCIGSSL